MGNNTRHLIKLIFDSFKMLKSNPSSHVEIKNGETTISKAKNNYLRGVYLSKESVFELLDASRSSDYKIEIADSNNSISVLIHKNT